MADRLFEFLGKVRANPKVQTFDEASTKQGVILPILQLLGWNTYDVDEVTPEFSVEYRKVDYSLRIKDHNEVFLEAKKPSEDLENHQEQLLDYSFHQGVEFAILTNGAVWWFYLPLKKADWKARKFYAIDIMEQELKEVASRFAELLSKNAVQSGKAIEHAETLYKGRIRQKTIEKALPEAWNRMVSEPEPLLIDLLAEITEKLCGHKPQQGEAEEMLRTYKAHILILPVTQKITVPKKKHHVFEKKTSEKENYFDSISPYKEQRIQENILNRKKLWKAFIEKGELTVKQFGELSHFRPKAIAGFMRYVEANGLARKLGDTFKLSEDVITPIRKLLEEGIHEPEGGENYFESLTSTKEKRILDYILNRKELWESFIENRKITLDEFKHLSDFKPKAIGGFTHFLKISGTATRFGDTFELAENVIPHIRKLLE